eukprot:m51a1_g3846 hypothetical protein (230) ;mRNA; f:363329-364018
MSARKRSEYVALLAPKLAPHSGLVCFAFDTLMWRRPAALAAVGLAAVLCLYFACALWDAHGYLPCALGLASLWFLLDSLVRALVDQGESARAAGAVEVPQGPTFAEAVDCAATLCARWDEAWAMLAQQKRLQPGLYTCQVLVAVGALWVVGVALSGRSLLWLLAAAAVGLPGALYNGVLSDAWARMGPIVSEAGKVAGSLQATLAQKTGAAQAPAESPSLGHRRPVSIP